MYTDIMSSLLYRYVDVILQLIDKAGDFVSDDIWFRVVQFVTNNEDLQVCLKLVVTMILLPNLHIIHKAFSVFVSLMLRQKLENILTNLLYMRQWLRFVCFHCHSLIIWMLLILYGQYFH